MPGACRGGLRYHGPAGEGVEWSCRCCLRMRTGVGPSRHMGILVDGMVVHAVGEIWPMGVRCWEFSNREDGRFCDVWGFVQVERRGSWGGAARAKIDCRRRE